MLPRQSAERMVTVPCELPTARAPPSGWKATEQQGCGSKRLDWWEGAGLEVKAEVATEMRRDVRC